MSEFEEVLGELSAEASEQELRDRIFRLQQANESTKRRADHAEKSRKRLEEEVGELATELELYQKDLSKRPRWLKSKPRDQKHHGTLVAFLSDTHYAEVVEPAELGGYNAYNMGIAEVRTRAFFEHVILLSRNYMSGVEYDGIVLPLGGDLVSGDIHDELKETNELSVLRTVETVVPWLAAGIEKLQEEFGNVHVVSAPGNHGRNSVKPRHKKRSENNADTHIARLLAMQFRGVDGVTFDVPESSDVDFDLYGYNFTVEHGDNLRFSGVAEIGSIGPIKRGTLRKTKKRQEQGKPFSYFLLGHFHQYIPAYTQGFIANGSLKGYDEYASDGQFPPEKPQQALLLVTPEHGVTAEHPIFVSKREKEGW